MYKHVWNKYLPVIKILLKKSAVGGVQKLGLNRTDFERGTKGRKASCSFHIELEKGRVTTISPAAPAKELVASLLEDETAKGLLRQNNYKITLRSDLELIITNLTPAATEAPEPGQEVIQG